MLRIIIGILIALFPLVGHADIDISIAQKQGFENYTPVGIGGDFVCKNQCFIILPNLEKYEYLEIKGAFSGKGEIGYGFLNGNQILAGAFSRIDGITSLSNKFNFSDNAYYSQLPKEITVILVINGEISGKRLRVNMGQFSPFERFTSHFESAIRYVPFSPRTINFLEGPMWGGEYINKAFFSWILFLLAIALIWSMFEKNHHHRMKKSILFGFFVIVFFWLFFDFFSTQNQLKMYQDFRSAKTFMDNGRLAKDGDFYGFLDFVRSKVPERSLGNFIVPYPFDGEGKYHMYPYIKFQNPESLEYVFTYNPYGKNAPFGFVDPVYDEGKKVLTWNPSETRNYTWNIREVLSFGNFGKIYVINK